MKILSKIGLAGLVLSTAASLASAQHSNLPSEFYSSQNAFTAANPAHPLSMYSISESQPATQPSSALSQENREEIYESGAKFGKPAIVFAGSALGLVALGGVLSLGEHIIDRRRYKRSDNK